jgi:flagellar biosynthesis chaperone FliJ
VINSSAIKLAVLAGLGFVSVLAAPAARAQDNASTQTPAAGASNQDQNVQEYIALLRKDIRSQKSAVMSDVMLLDPDQAAKFWPIYRDYDAALTKLNDLRVANIKEYSRTYTKMTDAKADELVHNAMSYQKQRAELLAQYYDKMKQALGGVTAARFLMVESQMLLIIDLQIDSSLPIVGSSQD